MSRSTYLDVLDAPEFPAIVPAFLARLTRADLVIAHNAKFDIEHLRETLDHFGLPRPEFDYVCTCQLARRVWPELPNHQLSTLTAHIGHDFNHHHAQADAEVAGRVLLAHRRNRSTQTRHASCCKKSALCRSAFEIECYKCKPITVLMFRSC